MLFRSVALKIIGRDDAPDATRVTAITAIILIRSDGEAISRPSPYRGLGRSSHSLACLSQNSQSEDEEWISSELTPDATHLQKCHVDVAWVAQSGKSPDRRWRLRGRAFSFLLRNRARRRLLLLPGYRPSSIIGDSKRLLRTNNCAASLELRPRFEVGFKTRASPNSTLAISMNRTTVAGQATRASAHA